MKPAVAILVLLSFAACATMSEPTPPPADVTTSFCDAGVGGEKAIRRVLVPPFQDLAGSASEAERVRQSFLRALGRRERFELIPVGEQALHEVLPASVFDSGVVPKQALLAISKHFRADGVLFGVLTQFGAYQPLVVGLKIELVSADNGKTVWAASGHFDGSTRTVVQDVHNYHDMELQKTASLEGWRLILMSPSRFADYACARVAETLR